MSVVEVGRVLRERRTSLGRTVSSVAMEAGLSLPYVANLEAGRGNPTLNVLESLADALDVPLAALFEGSAGDDRRRREPPPNNVASFAASTVFQREVRGIAKATAIDVGEIRRRLMHILVVAASEATRPMSEAEMHLLLLAAAVPLRKV